MQFFLFWFTFLNFVDDDDDHKDGGDDDDGDGEVGCLTTMDKAPEGGCRS